MRERVGEGCLSYRANADSASPRRPGSLPRGEDTNLSRHTWARAVECVIT